MISFIEKYFFYGTGQYNCFVGDDFLPLGFNATYVTSNILNGFVNLYSPISCWLLNRYEDWDKPFDDGLKCIKLYIDNFNKENIDGCLVKYSQSWPKYGFTTKGAAYRTMISGQNFHTNLNDFCDDVIMLSYNKERHEYCYFWFDNDVSDCCIGRFKTDDPQEEVIRLFSEWVKSVNADEPYYDEELRENGSGEPREIPVSCLGGWISF